jgi:hypothetical protein
MRYEVIVQEWTAIRGDVTEQAPRPCRCARLRHPLGPGSLALPPLPATSEVTRV